MKKTGIINSQLMGALTSLGHTDRIAITDSGLPIPKECPVIDLALVEGIPSFIDTVKAVLNEIIVEKIITFRPMEENNPTVYNQLMEMLPNQDKGSLDGEDFLNEARKDGLDGKTKKGIGLCDIRN